MNIDRSVSRANRAVAAKELEVAKRLRAYLIEAERRLLRDIRAGFPRSKEQNRVLREARARALLAQVQQALAALRLDVPANGITDVIREAIRAGAGLADQQQTAILREMAKEHPQAADRLNELAETMRATQVNTAAIEAQVRNAEARLQKHSVEAIEKINTAVVNGLVRGFGFQRVKSEIRDAITGPPGVYGGLAFHAETIARTELLSSLNDAREEKYRATGIEKAAWIATDDERVCPYCAARSGLLYALDDIVIPAHPRCRCTTIPFKDEWVEEGLFDPGDLKRHREDVIAAFNDAHKDDLVGMATGPTPFERANGVPKPRPIPLPGSDPYAGVGPRPVAGGPAWDPISEEDALIEVGAMSQNLWLLSDTEKALEFYSKFGYERINEGLRMGHIPLLENYVNPLPGYDPQNSVGLVRLIDAGMGATKLTHSVNLWRGYGTDQAVSDPSKLIGTYLTDQAYLSTSVRRDVAEGFANFARAEASREGGEVYLVKIRARQGQNAIPIMSLTGERDEAEVLLPRDLALRVVNAHRNDSGIIELEVEIGGPPAFRAESTNPYLTSDAMARLYSNVTQRLGPDADIDTLRTALTERGIPVGDGLAGRPVGMLNLKQDDLNPEMSKDIVVGMERIEQMFDIQLADIMSNGVDVEPIYNEPGTVAYVGAMRGNTDERVLVWNSIHDMNIHENVYLQNGIDRGDLQARDIADVREARAYNRPLPISPRVHAVAWRDRQGVTAAIHEIGHHVHYALENELERRGRNDPNWNIERVKFRSMWDQIRAADKPSKYARSDPNEAFAESWTQMLTHPEDVWYPSTRFLADWFRGHQERMGDDALFRNRLYAEEEQPPLFGGEP